MGKLITVVGNSGVGKTKLTQRLCSYGPFVSFLEQHEERPFQKRFSLDLQRYSLANQIDYSLFRAGQEKLIRESNAIGIQDGGLDEDFHVFTHYFFQKRYLKVEEYKLCERTYTFLRSFLPPPDLIIRLSAPLNVVAKRYAKRKRQLEIATSEDLANLDILLDTWMRGIESIPILTVDASADNYSSPEEVRKLATRINSSLDAWG